MFMRRVKIKPNLNRVTKPAPCSISFQVKSDPSSPSSKSHSSTPLPNKPSATVEEEAVKEIELLSSPAKKYSRQHTSTVHLVTKTEVKTENDADEPDIAVTSVIPPPASEHGAFVQVLTDEKPELITPETIHTSLNQDVPTPRIGVTAPDLDTKSGNDAIPKTVSSVEPEVEPILPTTDSEALTSVATESSIVVDLETERASVFRSNSVKSENQSASSTEATQTTENIPSSAAASGAEESVSSAPSRSESPMSVGQVCDSANRYEDSTVVNTNIRLESEPHFASSEKPQKRIKSEKEASRCRRLFQKNKEPPERSKMTMMDLIYYNPTDNPMTTVSTKRPSKDSTDGVQSKSRSLEAPPEVPAPALTPRVKIGEDGQIILDEESLVIEHTVPDGFNVVVEDSETTYFSFRDRVMTRRWNQDETALFYKGLTLFGTDFSLMSQIMQTRTRHELKLKFKKEERRNRKLIDVILRCQGAYGIAEFQNDVEEYIKKSEQEEEQSKKKKEKGKRSTKRAPSGKRGRGRKSGEDSDVESIAQSEYTSCGSPSLSTVDPGEESLSDSVQPKQTQLIEITCLVEEAEKGGSSQENETAIIPNAEDPQHENSPTVPVLNSDMPVKKQKKPRKPRKKLNPACDKKSPPTCDEKPPKVKQGKKRKQVLGPLKSKKACISKSDVQPQPSNIICQTEDSIASQEIILLSETGEVLPLEVVYDQPPLDCSLPQKAELISSIDEANRQPAPSNRPSTPAVSVEYQELENTLTAIFGEGGL